MIQALHTILGTEGDKSKVSMLYGSRSTGDILANETLDAWTQAHSERLAVTHVLSHEPEESKWEGERGFIGADLIKTNLPPPSEDTVIFVCGPPPMYEALCGPRDKPKELTGVLAEMGYTADQVYKF